MKKRFTGNTRLFLCISGAIIVIALIMQIVGVGLNLGIDFTGGSLLNYSVGEDYDVADVETILASAGYEGSQVTKAAPSDASIALQAELAQQAAEAAAEPVEEAAEETETHVHEDGTVHEGSHDEEAEAEEAEEFVPMLNLDKSSVKADGLTDLQIRLNLVDESEGLEQAIADAVAAQFPGATQLSYGALTNSTIVEKGLDVEYSGGYIAEFEIGEEFDSAAATEAIKSALDRLGGGGGIELFADLKLGDVAAGILYVQTLLHDGGVGQRAVAELGRARELGGDCVGDGLLQALALVHQVQANLQVGQAVGLDGGLVQIQHGYEFLGLLGLGFLVVAALVDGAVLVNVRLGFLSSFLHRLGSGLCGLLCKLRLQGDGSVGGRGLGDLAALVAGAGEDGFHIGDVVVLADGVVQQGAAGEVDAQIQADADDLHDQSDDNDCARDAQEEARISGKSFLHGICPPLIAYKRCACGCPACRSDSAASG